MKKIRWTEQGQKLIEILCDDISQVYESHGNIIVHLGSDYGEESPHEVVKRETLRLIIPHERFGQFVEQMNEARVFFAKASPEAAPQNPAPSVQNIDQWGQPFPLDE